MKRLKLLETLETVAPALSSKDAIPILTHLWFTSKQVLAFNDGIAISATLETPWSAAVPAVLIKLLQASGAIDVEFTLNNNGELRAVAAAAKIKLPTLPPEDFVFTMPALKKDETASISGPNLDPFIEALAFAVQCVSSEATVPEQLGVSLLPGKNDLASMYATNEKSLFYTKIKTNKAIKRVILSEEFCKQMLTLYNNESESPALYLRDDSAIFKVGGTTLFGKLIHSDQPLDFEGVLSRHFPAKTKLFDTPVKMKPILDRACIIIGNGGDTEAVVTNGEVRFKSYDQRTDRAVNDVMEIDTEQDELTIKFNPGVAKLATDAGMDKIRLTKNCVIFSKGDLVLLVTAKV
jgi:DNA polymerase III sliding clamp (beta) subunit (PCNA family)